MNQFFFQFFNQPSMNMNTNIPGGKFYFQIDTRESKPCLKVLDTTYHEIELDPRQYQGKERQILQILAGKKRFDALHLDWEEDFEDDPNLVYLEDYEMIIPLLKDMTNVLDASSKPLKVGLESGLYSLGFDTFFENCSSSSQSAPDHCFGSRNKGLLSSCRKSSSFDSHRQGGLGKEPTEKGWIFL